MQKLFKIFFLGCFLLFILIPIILLLLGSFGEIWYGTILPQGLFTLKWYKILFKEIMYIRSMKISLLVGTLSVIGNIVIGVPAVYTIYNSQFYNQEWIRLTGTWQIVLFSHLLFTLPFMIEPVHANLKLIDWKLLNEAAESLGASFIYKITRILIPNLLPGILSGALMVFTMSLGEFQLAVMLSGFRTQTYPVVLFQAFSRETGFACSATTILIGVSIFSLLGIMRLLRITRTA